MTTSQQTAFLSEILDGSPIPQGKQAYFSARLRNDFYDVVMRLFLEKKISKAELARRLGKDSAQITRWLSSPGNWTFDTLSNFLLGMGYGGALLTIDLSADTAVSAPMIQAPDEQKTEGEQHGENILKAVDALKKSGEQKQMVIETPKNAMSEMNSSAHSGAGTKFTITDLLQERIAA